MPSPQKLCVLFAFGMGAAVAAEVPAAPAAPIPRPEARPEAGISPDILTNEGVVALADAGYSDAFIAERILVSNRTRFDISVEGLLYLRRNAIPQDLVQFILEHAAQPSLHAAPVEPVVPIVAMTKGRGKKMDVAVVPPTTSALAPAPGFIAAKPVGVMPMPVAPAATPITAVVPLSLGAGQAASVYVYTAGRVPTIVYVNGSAYTNALAKYGSYASLGEPQAAQAAKRRHWWWPSGGGK